MGGMGLGSHGLACSGRMLKGGEGSGSARGVVEEAVRKEWVPGKATACGGGGVWQCSHGEVLGMQVAMTCCAGTRVVMVEPSVAMLGTLGSAVRVNGIPTGSEL